MNRENPERGNFDVALISQPGKTRRAHIRDALHIEKNLVKTSGQFIKVFTNIFLKREAGVKSYF